MLVTVAVLVLLMTILVQIFQAATGSLSSAQSYQELDNSLRRLDATIRSDLNGVTARLTPPMNPKDGRGYFEYGENAFADLQGEDSDDYIRFTAKAPPGRPFRGRMLVNPPVDPSNLSSGQLNVYVNQQPILITSEYAEIIYFLRNGNLYRRVLLIAPERQSSIMQMTNNINVGWATPSAFTPGAFGGAAQVSWQGVNDLSARPSSTGPNGGGASRIVLNSLGDLTNRENRPFLPHFANDYVNNTTGATPPDAVADDSNGDGVPDFYPTLYLTSAGAFSAQLQSLINAPGYALPTGANFSSMAFPYIFPGAYSQPETDSANSFLGWIHSPVPDQTVYRFSGGGASALLYLQRLNHNPLDLGDNLYRPQVGQLNFQTWWGFPTARETMSFGWADPTWQLNLNGGAQPIGLNPRDPTNVNGNVLKVVNDGELLPPMTGVAGAPVNGSVRETPQLYSDAFGVNSTVLGSYGLVNATQSLWPSAGEPDLILTGVRSFDVKAYDDLYAGYADLGWKNDVRISGNLPEFNKATDNTQNYNFLFGTPSTAYSPFAGSPFNTTTPAAYGTSNPPFVGASWMSTMATFGHEGRMPPLTTDNRADAQFPTGYYPNYASYPFGSNDLGVGIANIGDDASNVNRLRRVFDTWSTDYTAAPAHATNPATGVVYGPPLTPPVLPSYPPPYPAPLRGIQIQVRVADPTNQRIKQVTIRHDFSDRL